MRYRAVIFDLDGVLVTTDDCHYSAWKRMADEEGIPFSRDDNQRLRGVSRMESLQIILEKSPRAYTAAQAEGLAARKNGYYIELIEKLDEGAVLPGAREFVQAVKALGLKAAIGSSSRNTAKILQRTGLAGLFDAVADGNMIARSKPDPEVFLLAAELLGVEPRDCLVAEDAAAGVEAALKGGMDVLAVGFAAADGRATYRAASLADISAEMFN